MAVSAHPRKKEPVSKAVLNQLLARRAEFLKFIEKRVDSRATAEDILQSAFVRGIEKEDSLRGEESTVAWFYRLLRNAVIDHYRSKGTRSKFLEEWPEDLDVAGEPVEFVKNEICTCVTHVLEEIKPQYVEALNVVDIQERPISDLAKQTGISTNNATVRVHRAREALRKQVELTCGVCATHGCVDCRCKKAHSNRRSRTST